MKVIQIRRKRKHKISARHRILRISAIHGIARERWRVTKIFQSTAAVPAVAVRATDPGHAHARTNRKIRRTSLYDIAYNLMPRNHVWQDLREIALYNVQVRPAYTTGPDAKKNLLRSGARIRDVSNRERRLRDSLR